MGKVERIYLVNPQLFDDKKRLIEIINKGVDANLFSYLSGALDITKQDLAEISRIDIRTVHRRAGEGRFHPDESDRLMRFSKLLKQATEVLGSYVDALHWLKSPNHDIGGKFPLAHAATEPGAQEVSDLLVRIEYGVIS
jgi:putative toxin-antitoxin system antitoxin component (TIGR02293 family)